MHIETMNHSHDLENHRMLSLDGYRVNAATEHGAPEESCLATIVNSYTDLFSIRAALYHPPCECFESDRISIPSTHSP